jgi:alpha/beta hydrolase fold
MYAQVGKFDAVVSAAGNLQFGALSDMTPEQYAIGLNDKLMGQIKLVILGQGLVWSIFPWLQACCSFLHRDDVALFYETTRGEGPPVVLIHGWCCDHTFFAPQAANFAQAGHAVTSLDLRGHGRSDKPHQSYPISAFATDVAWVCGALGLSRPVLIGHSMGGIVAFDVACRHPDLPSAVVMLDSAVVLPAAVRAAIPRAVCTENLNTGVVVMKSAQDGK